MWYDEISKYYDLPIDDAVVDIHQDGDIYIKKGDRKYYIGSLSLPEDLDVDNSNTS